MLSHDGALLGLVSNNFTERCIRIFFPLLRHATIYRRLKFVGKIGVRCWPLVADLLIFIMPVRSVSQCLPKRDILSRRMWGFTVNISTVALITERLLFLRSSWFHIN